MKTVARIYRWIIISLIIQVIILIYFNNIYLKRSVAGNLKVTEYDTVKKVSSTSVNIPENAKNIQVSSDSAYVMYSVGNSIEFIEVEKNKKVKTINSPEGTELTFFEWISGKNIAIYTFSMENLSSPELKVYTYDVENDVERYFGGNSDNVDDTITSVPAGSIVVDICMSAPTNTAYVKVKTGENRAKLYKYETQGVLSTVGYYDIGIDFEMAYLEDTLLYRSEFAKLAVRTGRTGEVKVLSFDNDFIIIGVDNDDNIYLAELNNEGKVTGVIYGRHDEEPKQSWKRLTLSTPTEKDDVLLTSNGNVYVLEKNQKILYNMKSQNNKQFTGKFLQATENYIITQESGKLFFDPINK